MIDIAKSSYSSGMEHVTVNQTEPVAVAVRMRTCDCKPVEGVGRRGGWFLVTEESPIVMI